MAGAVGTVAGSPRPLVPVVFDRQAGHLGRDVERGRALVVVEVGVQHSSGLSVENASLREREADAHGHTAEDLVLVGDAVHDATAVVHRQHPRYPDLAGASVDLHLGEVHAKRKAQLGRVGMTVPDRHEHPALLEALELGNRQGSVRLVDRHDLAVPEEQLTGRSLQLLGGDLEDLASDLDRGGPDGRRVVDGRATAAADLRIGCGRRVGPLDLDPVQRDPQLLGCHHR
jgi:hypothetical protein